MATYTVTIEVDVVATSRVQAARHVASKMLSFMSGQQGLTVQVREANDEGQVGERVKVTLRAEKGGY